MDVALPHKLLTLLPPFTERLRNEDDMTIWLYLYGLHSKKGEWVLDGLDWIPCKLLWLLEHLCCLEWMIMQYFEFAMKSIKKNPRQSRLVITCFMARLKLVKGRGIELHQVVQSSWYISSDIKSADFILRKDLAICNSQHGFKSSWRNKKEVFQLVLLSSKSNIIQCLNVPSGMKRNKPLRIESCSGN